MGSGIGWFVLVVYTFYFIVIVVIACPVLLGCCLDETGMSFQDGSERHVGVVLEQVYERGLEQMWVSTLLPFFCD